MPGCKLFFGQTIHKVIKVLPIRIDGSSNATFLLETKTFMQFN
jgi:hypothetical protein